MTEQQFRYIQVHMQAQIKRIDRKAILIDQFGNVVYHYTITAITQDLGEQEYLHLARSSLNKHILDMDIICPQFEMLMPMEIPVDITKWISRVREAGNSGLEMGLSDAQIFERVMETPEEGAAMPENPQDTKGQPDAQAPAVDTGNGILITATNLVNTYTLVDSDIPPPPSHWEESQWLGGIRAGDTVAVTNPAPELPVLEGEQGIVQGIRWHDIPDPLPTPCLEVRLGNGIGELVLLPRSAVKLLAAKNVEEARRSVGSFQPSNGESRP